MSTSKSTSKKTKPQRIAVIGAGMAGITAARTLVQAGHSVTVFEKSRGVSGRMSTRRTEFGSFDHGAQYFTVRDARFRQLMDWALATAPDIARPWGANAVRVLDSTGRTVEAALPRREPHWVAQPGMNALVQHMAAPLVQAGAVQLNTQVSHLRREKNARITLTSHNPHDKTQDEAEHSGFDAVLLAMPHVQALALLEASQRRATLQKQEHSVQWIQGLEADFIQKLQSVKVDPCWTLMLAFPQASTSLRPQWSAARSTHHRIAWLARESSKPGREMVERWTVQASAAWSAEHLEDDAERVKAKLVKAFSEITGIRAEPGFAQVHRWRYAKTAQPLGNSHIWSATARLGICGDWCLGHRVEDAFVSGLELALAFK